MKKINLQLILMLKSKKKTLKEKLGNEQKKEKLLK